MCRGQLSDRGVGMRVLSCLLAMSRYCKSASCLPMRNSGPHGPDRFLPRISLTSVSFPCLILDDTSPLQQLP